MKSKRKCSNCNKEFHCNHGNRLYCSNECKNAKKSNSQQKVYRLLREFRKGYLANLKLFEYLNSIGQNSLPINEANAFGFNQYSYYGTYQDERGYPMYKVGPYFFSIIKKSDKLFVTLSKP